VTGVTSTPYDIRDLRGCFTLIAGDVKAGKTMLTQRLLEAYLDNGQGSVTVVDCTPTIMPSDVRGISPGGVGGRLRVSPSPRVRVFFGPISPPRLRARGPEEAEGLAQENAQIIEGLFRDALAQKRDALFVNDCSLYLHAGKPETLLLWLRSTHTSVVNGYYGCFFPDSPLTRREREGMAFLMERCDRLIAL